MYFDNDKLLNYSTFKHFQTEFCMNNENSMKKKQFDSNKVKMIKMTGQIKKKKIERPVLWNQFSMMTRGFETLFLVVVVVVYCRSD